MTEARAPLDDYRRRQAALPGNIEPLDVFGLSEAALTQTQLGIRGDILEIGAFKGKSAVLLGLVLAEGENLAVCDLFGDRSPDPDNQAETAEHYAGLARRDFEENYRSFHQRPPAIYQCPSEELPARFPPEARFRLVHVDGSHLYKAVMADARTAREHLVTGGIVVFDDFRSPHAPGVAAAVWEQVATAGLAPLWVTEAKFYGSWESVGRPIVTRIEERAREQGIGSEAVVVGEHRFLRFLPPTKPLLRRITHALVPPVFGWARDRAKAGLSARRA